MTSEQFRKTGFKATMLVDYIHPQTNKAYTCFLSNVDFDNEILTIIPLDTAHKNREWYVSAKNCEVHSKKVKRLEFNNEE